MGLPFDYRLKAREDIDEAYHWYEAQQAGRGEEFLRELAARVDDVCAAPDLFGRVRGDVRAVPLPKSKYVVYNRVDGGRVVVLAVQHAHADPRRWQGRR